MKIPQLLLQSFEDFLIPAFILFLTGNALAWALPDLPFARLDIGIFFIVALLGIVCLGLAKSSEQTGQNGGHKKSTRWAIRADLWAIMLILGSMNYHYRHFNPSSDRADQGLNGMLPASHATVIGRVMSQPNPNQLILTVSQVNHQPVSGLIEANLPPTENNPVIEAGTRVLIEGSLLAPFKNTIPGSFNQAEYFRGQHIIALLKFPARFITFERSNEPHYVLQRITDDFKNRIMHAFSSHLPSPQGEILGGVVLGDKAIPVDGDTKQAFIHTGLIHVLSASGMNVAVVAMGVLWLTARLKAPYRLQLCVAMAAVVFYSLLTGLPPSIQRAAVMLILGMTLKLFSRQLSPVFLLCVATTVLVLWNPDTIASIGFQFSVLTTFGLMTMLPPLEDFLGTYITRWAAALFLTPFIAQLWIWPLSIAYFNQFPIHSIPLNIIGIAMVGPLTLIGFVAALASLTVPSLVGILCLLAKPFLDALLWLVHWGDGMGWAQWFLPTPSPWQIAGLYALLMLLLGILYRLKAWSFQRKCVAALFPLALLIGLTWITANQSRACTTLNLVPLSKRHEAILLQPSSNQAAILLMPERLSTYEARDLASFLRHANLHQLDLVLTLPTSGERPQTEKAALKNRQHWQTITQNVHITRLVHMQAPGFQIRSGTHSGFELADMQVHDNSICLLSVEPEMDEGNSDQGNNACSLRLVEGKKGKRLYSDSLTMLEENHQDAQDERNPDKAPQDESASGHLFGHHFYHLIQEGSQLLVYTQN